MVSIITTLFYRIANVFDAKTSNWCAFLEAFFQICIFNSPFAENHHSTVAYIRKIIVDPIKCQTNESKFSFTFSRWFYDFNSLCSPSFHSWHDKKPQKMEHHEIEWIGSTRSYVQLCTQCISDELWHQELRFCSIPFGNGTRKLSNHSIVDSISFE